MAEMPKIYEEVQLYLEQIVREDFIGLYGFKDREEFTLLVRMIHAITKSALVTYTKAKDKKKVRENYQKQLYFLKYGVYQD